MILDGTNAPPPITLGVPQADGSVRLVEVVIPPPVDYVIVDPPVEE